MTRQLDSFVLMREFGQKAISSGNCSLWVRGLLGSVLIAAAVLKAQDIVGQPASHIDRWLLCSLVGFEGALGALLLVGLAKNLTRLLALISFGVFACVSLYGVIAGLPSCGCFGKLQVPPLYTSIFDLLAVLGLAAFAPPASPQWARRGGVALAGVAVLAFAVTGVVGVWVRDGKRAALGEDGAIAGAGALVVLEPQEWVGKRLPILPHIVPAEVGERLAEGQWTVLLYHHDCPTCLETIPQYERRAAESGGEVRVALIEMPPYAAAGEGPVSATGSACVLGKLSDEREWFATTPLVIALREGQVVSTLEGEDVKHTIFRGDMP